MVEALRSRREVLLGWTAAFVLCSIPFLVLACRTPAEPTAPVVIVTAPTGSAPPVAIEKTDASDDQAGVKTLFVREVRADCEGEGPMKCLQVRDAESEPWSLFYGAIEGFTYEDAYKYELRVKLESGPRRPSGGWSRRLRLIAVVSKQKVGT